MRLFEDEFRAELDRPHRIYGTKQIDVVTGTMAGPLITELMDELHRQYPMIDVKVHVVKNIFFGGNDIGGGDKPRHAHIAAKEIILDNVRES